MPDVALLLLVAADPLVARLRARVAGWDFEDMADQRDTLARLIEGEVRAARLRGVSGGRRRADRTLVTRC